MLVARSVTVVAGSRLLLERVSVSLVPGEVLAVLGENGAGKSTLLHALAGDRDPDFGDVWMNGRRLRSWSVADRARQRAVLPQEHELAFAFSALEVALLGRYPHSAGLPVGADVDIARDALRRVGCAHLQDRHYPSLSGGERARVHFARVLAQLVAVDGDRQRYLLLDEPTASLDLAHQHLLLDLARNLARETGVGVLAILHDVNLAARYADRVALLKGGRLLEEGATASVLSESNLTRCYDVGMRRIEAGGRNWFMAEPSP